VTRWTDAGLIGLAAGLGALFYLDTQASDAPERPINLAIGIAACLAVPLRRRWPVGLALVLIPSVTVSSAAMGATAVAMAGVAAYRSLRTTILVLTLHAAFVLALFGLVAASRREYWQGVVVVLALDAALVASGLLVRSRRERTKEAEERQRLQIEEARHAERERLAREMHDVLAHRISLLAVHAGALEVRRSAPDEERQAAAVIRQCAYDALEDLREVIGMLRDEPADPDRPQPTLAGLPELIEQSRQAGTPVTLEDELIKTPEYLGRHVYRVVQEGLTNARKHAPGAPVFVRLSSDGDGEGLTVGITNPLPAAPASRLPGAGSGLIGLSERMHLVGGRLEHGRTETGEFRLHAWLPWRT
jgi:signal transduction histidine kinase